MINEGTRVTHGIFGEGETVTTPNKDGLVTVLFDKEFEVIEGKVTDTDYYFHDDRSLVKTRSIQVHPEELKLIRKKSFLTPYQLKDRNPNCHSCGKPLSSLTHQKCDKCSGWLKCNCGSCGCDYVPKCP